MKHMGCGSGSDSTGRAVGIFHHLAAGKIRLIGEVKRRSTKAAVQMSLDELRSPTCFRSHFIVFLLL